MTYNEQNGYQFNNQYPWKIDESEIAFVLAENGIRRLANLRPYKCWIPTLMGPVELPTPSVTTSPLSNGLYVNAPECKPPVSGYIQMQNYITVYAGDHSYYTHKWIDHGAEIWIMPTNSDILELYIDTSVDPSYCDSCAVEHPVCNIIHECVHER